MFIAQRTGPFTQAILRANTAGYLRQAVGLMGQRHGGVDIPACSRSIHWGIWLCSGQVHSQILCSPHCRQRSEACCACPALKGRTISAKSFLRIAAARLSASLRRGVVAIWLTFAPALDNAISPVAHATAAHPSAPYAGVAVWPSRKESLPSPAAAPAPGSFARRKVRLHGRRTDRIYVRWLSLSRRRR